jgi:hypothetical protein
MRVNKILFLAAQTVLLLSGCAAQMVEGNSDPKRVYENFDALPKVSINKGESKEFAFVESSPTLKFPNHASRFLAIQLPRNDSKVTLSIRTHISGSWIPSATVFVPSVTFLDAQNKPVRTIEQPEFRQGSDFLRISGNTFWEASVETEPGEITAVVYHAYGGAYGIPYAAKPSTKALPTGGALVFQGYSRIITHADKGTLVIAVR